MEQEKKIKDIETLLKERRPLEDIAQDILDGAFGELDMERKDSLDRFLDFVYSKVQRGNPFIIHLAYPTKRMIDSELEAKVKELINEHLYPDVILPLLKFFTRNVHNSDTNLYIAYLIENENIIKAIYETYLLFKKDIFETDKDKRTQNVRRMQQFLARIDTISASPLDAAARLKFILEFFALKQNISHIYTLDTVKLSN
ncbi:MAG: hypothetical protein AB1444_13500 [Spirochaetota bacterium]